MAKRAVAYTRYSSDNQREESIDAQWRAISEYCNRKGYVLTTNYSDEARSATSDQRPNFQKMIEDSKQRKFDLIIVHKLDRFARDRYDSAFYKRALKIEGVRIESVLEHLDDSPESIILESVLEGMAEYYSRNLARETRKGLRENALVGKHVGGRPPYGYRLNAETRLLEINEKAAPAVRFYFNSILEGKSLNDIAISLNGMGYRTYSGKQFTKNSFWDWASNKKYIGIYTWDVRCPKNPDGTRNNHKKRDETDQIQVENVIPAIIDLPTWEKVNEIMEKRKKKPGSMKAKIPYLLSDKIFCKRCGSLYRGSSYRNWRLPEERYSYYKCSGNCGNKPINKNDFEKNIIEQALCHFFNPDALETIIEKVQRLFQDEQERGTKESQPIKDEIHELKTKIGRWIDALGDGLITKEMIADKMSQAKQRMITLQSQLERIDSLNVQQNLPKQFIKNYLEQRKNQLLSDNSSDKKLILQELIDRIDVDHDLIRDKYRIDLTIRLLHGVESGT
ncbi:MAG: recombinase family protein [Acidibacillus sp.]|nr:recombinase family protein [Acidibacillus sp.]